MIQEFPENHELIWLFEAEPEVADPDERWFFNTLVFEAVRSDVIVVCIISPSYGDIRVMLKSNDINILDIQINSAARIRVISEKGREFLRAEFEQDNLLNFELQMKPYTQVTWGNSIY